MPEMVSAYMRFCAEPEMSMRLQSAERAQQAAVEEIYEIDVVDMFGTFLPLFCWVVRYTNVIQILPALRSSWIRAETASRLRSSLKA
jgi:hypothetical protein